jgi:hypothetical protein
VERVSVGEHTVVLSSLASLGQALTHDEAPPSLSTACGFVWIPATLPGLLCTGLGTLAHAVAHQGFSLPSIANRADRCSASGAMPAKCRSSRAIGVWGWVLHTKSGVRSWHHPPTLWSAHRPPSFTAYYQLTEAEKTRTHFLSPRKHGEPTHRLRRGHLRCRRCLRPIF